MHFVQIRRASLTKGLHEESIEDTSLHNNFYFQTVTSMIIFPLVLLSAISLCAV